MQSHAMFNSKLMMICFSVWTHFLKSLKRINLIKLAIKVQSVEILLACSQLLSDSHSHDYSTCT